MMYNNKSTKLEDKLFKIIVILGGVLSVICIIGNIIFGFPLQINIKLLFILLLSVIILLYSSSFFIKYLKLIYFISIILIVIPYGWIDSGGSNNTIAYIFLLMICISFVFKDRIRIILVILLILTFITLLILEYTYPQVIAVHSEQKQFFDRLVQIPLVLIVSYLLLKRFTDEYFKEREILKVNSNELKQANEKLKFMANRDELTKLHNRRVFDAKLDEVINNGMYLNEDIYVILIDIDSFKRINDTYGHTSGDKVLCRLAEITKEIMPENSVISRWGGDEFGIIIFKSLSEIKSYINSLFIQINNIKVNNKVIGISAGITKIKGNDTTQNVFNRVDEGLYKSKRCNTNKYTII